MKKFEELFKNFTPKKNLEKEFERIAKTLMTEFVIKVNKTEFYLTEIEFYCKTKNDNHKDPYVHGNDLQKKLGRWYFHGSGLDLTFGNENYFGGILIRGIKRKNKEGNWDYTSGPINIVRELFSVIDEVDKKATFQLIHSIKNEVQNGLFFIKRIGLNKDKYPKNTFFNKKYRAIIDINNKHKFSKKTNVAVELNRSGIITKGEANILFWNNILK